jgi:hypothetical protein
MLDVGFQRLDVTQHFEGRFLSMITPGQVKDVEQLRTSVHTLINKGAGDEYLLATYNGI